MEAGPEERAGGMKQKNRHSLTRARPWLRAIRFRLCGKARVRVRRGAGTGAGPGRAGSAVFASVCPSLRAVSGAALGFLRISRVCFGARLGAALGRGGRLWPEAVVSDRLSAVRVQTREWWRRTSCEGDRAARGPGAPRGATELTVTAPNSIEQKPVARCGWWELE